MSTAVLPAPWRRRLAVGVGEVLAPWVLAVLVPVGVAAGVSASTRTLSLGVTAAVFTGVLPAALLGWGVRRGWWSDRSVPRREDRPRLLGVCAAPVVVGLVVLLVAGAPGELVLLFPAALVGALVVGLVSRRWKVSLHTTAAGGSAAALVASCGPIALPGLLVVALVAWARVEVRAHTPAQALVGALVGVVVAGAVMAPG